MRRFAVVVPLVAAALQLAPLPASAEPQPGSAPAVSGTLTQAGFTGLGITPNAHHLGWGRMELSYDHQLPGVRDTTGHNYVLGFGLLPNLEIVGRVAANSLHANCFSEGCGARDLSASAKASIGLDAYGHFRIAGGVTDVGGAVTYFRTAYGVLTYNEGPMELSAGLARRSGSGINGSRSPLDGPFAGAAWQPVSWLRGHVEYADGDAWAGVRAFAPAHWLPSGWQFSVGAHRRLTDASLTERHWWSASLSIPLYKVPAFPARGTPAATAAPPAQAPALQGNQRPLPAYEAATPAPPATVSRAPQQAAPSATAPVADAQLWPLVTALTHQGFQDIWVGRMADQSIAIRAENASYRWNSLDALGAGLAAIANTLGEHAAAYRFILTERQQPLVAVTGQANCLREWIARDTPACPGGELSTPGTTPLDALHGGANWLYKRANPGWKTLRVGFSPVLRTNVGTEVGVLDYSLGANIGLQLPLWHGATAELRQNVPAAHSSDYEDGGLFAARRVRSQTERIAFTQTLRLPLDRWLAPGDDVAARRWGLAAVTGQVTAGRIGGWYDGALGALRWEPGEGIHRVTAQGGRFRHSDFGDFTKPGPQTATPLLAGYRYHVAPTRTYLEATAGQFMNNDRGLQLGLRQWFSDVSVHVFYKRTRFEGDAARQFAGIELSLPVGPRRDMAAMGPVQIFGTPRFSTGLETVVGGTANPVLSGRGALPPVPSLDATFNSDRAGLRYFEDNIRRIRDAARQQGT